jgi:hypothetical protein
VENFVESVKKPCQIRGFGKEFLKKNKHFVEKNHTKSRMPLPFLEGRKYPAFCW